MLLPKAVYDRGCTATVCIICRDGKSRSHASQHVAVLLRFDADLCFGGNATSPAAFGEFNCFSAPSSSKKKKLVADLSTIIEKYLGVSSGRFLIKVPDRVITSFSAAALVAQFWCGSRWQTQALHDLVRICFLPSQFHDTPYWALGANMGV